MTARQMTSESRFASVYGQAARASSRHRGSRVIRIAHQRQVNEFLDCAAAKLGPDPIVFALCFVCVGCGDQSMPPRWRYSRQTATPDALIQSRIKSHPQTRDGGWFGAVLARADSIERRCSAPPLLRSGTRIRPGEFEGEDELVLALPQSSANNAAPVSEILKRRNICSRDLRAPACNVDSILRPAHAPRLTL